MEQILLSPHFTLEEMTVTKTGLKNVPNVSQINGLSIECKLIKTYSKGKLFFAQERLVVTDLNNVYIKSVDVIDIVGKIM